MTSKQRFLGLMAIVSALLIQGCAATTTTGVSATVGSNPKPPSVAGVPKPPAQFAASASVDFAICTNSEISGGLDYLKVLKNARELDGEVVAKLPNDDAKNSGWKALLKKSAGATEIKQCTDSASQIVGVLGTRQMIAQTLCDLRRGEGGGAAFKEETRAQLHAVIAALKDAAKKTTLAECQKATAGAEPGLLALVDASNTECSPRGADQDVSCSAKLKRYCTGETVAEAELAECRRGPSATRAVDARSPSAANAEARGVGAGAGLQSAILTGAADFFVERAEQEMSLFAVEVVGRELCADSSPVKDFLPKTCGLIGPPPKGESADTLGATPGAIRAAAKADLEALPASLIVKIHTQDPNLGCAAAFGWAVADEVGHGADLITLLKDPKALLERKLVADSCALGGAKQDIESLAKYLQQLLSGAPEFVASQLRSGNFERLVSTNRDLTTAVAGNASIGAELTKPGSILAEVLRRLVELDRAISAYHADPTPARRVVMVMAAIQTVEPILAHLARDAAYKEDIRTAIDLFIEILNHQYTEAIITASSFKVAQQLLPRNARNLMSLTAGLAQADSSDDVKKTLQDAALPLGSWRRKNVPRFGITLTGMVGGYLGHEFVTEKPQANVDVSNGTSLAPALLVGTDLHWGLGGSRLGLHFIVLDLGALATIRLDDPKSTNETTGGEAGSVDANADVRIEQVFAPGLFAYFGLGPFAFGPMATFVPSLRPYQESNGDINPLTVFRVGGVLAVDVSVLPLL